MTTETVLLAIVVGLVLLTDELVTRFKPSQRLSRPTYSESDFVRFQFVMRQLERRRNEIRKDREELLRHLQPPKKPTPPDIQVVCGDIDQLRKSLGLIPRY